MHYILKKKMEVCRCLSDWCKESNLRAFNERCNQCNKGFGNELRLGSTLMIGCKCVLTRMHAWTVCYHENCKCIIPKEEVGLERFPLILQSIPKDKFEGIRVDYFKRNPQIISMCAECGAPANTKTKLCKGCRCVYYCTAECQKANWGKHKIFCKSHPSSEGLCPCFTDIEKLCYQRFKKHMCCIEACSNPVDMNRPQELAFIYTVCSKKVPHILPKIFCSDKCSEIDKKRFN